MQTPLRRGLPRVSGGEPWPPAGSVVDLDMPDHLVADASPATPVADHTVTAPAVTGAEKETELTAVPLRRGLPRVPGGQPFPPATETLLRLPVARQETVVPGVDEPADTAAAEPVAEDGTATDSSDTTVSDYPRAAARPAPATQTPKTRQDAAAPRPKRDWLRWIAAAVSLGFALAFGVLLARFIASTGWGSEFIARYDGLQPLPKNAPVGFPAWLNWAHFFNMFLMVMIIKTGLAVRSERRPTALWAPRGNPRAKISLTLWLHLMLDIAWILLGIIFYILLFATGQWVRIVPTSWEVFPNALSAGLQLMTLNWPVENGWVHYNALQELTYFSVVFIAAPLAIFSGARMSPWWPKNVQIVPMKFARAVHFPTMIFFVGFIITHIALVLLTGMRRNLNAMFAARGSVDPAAYTADWTGTLLALGAVAIIAVAWFAARPTVVAPLARLTGSVSAR